MQFDLSKIVIVLEAMLRVMGRTLLSKMMIAFWSIFLACMALHAIVMADTGNPKVLVGEAVIALLIMVLFIFTKPWKPTRPQHPVPSSEPPHLMRGIRSR
jgi:hypothetical protein